MRVWDELGVGVKLETESWRVAKVDSTVDGEDFVCEQVTEGREDGFSIWRVGLKYQC